MSVMDQRLEWADRLETVKLTQKSPPVVTKVCRIPSVGCTIPTNVPASCTFLQLWPDVLLTSNLVHRCVGFSQKINPLAAQMSKECKVWPPAFWYLRNSNVTFKSIPQDGSQAAGPFHSSLNTVQGVWRLNKWGLQ